MICDRCGRKSSKPAWVIEMWELGKETEHTEEGILNNISNNMKRKTKKQDKYCLDCVKDIRKAIFDI